MTGTAEPFLQAIALEPLAGGLRFRAHPQPVPWPKAYGGDTAAQALAAAMRTVGDDRSAHSFHGYFLRPVDTASPVEITVDPTRDGRGFSARAVTVEQHGKTVLSALCSFAVPAPGDAHPASVAPDVPAPETLPSTAAWLAEHGVEGPAADYWAHGRSVDVRHVEGPVYRPGAPVAAEQSLWLRPFSRVPDDPATAALALAWMCDATILESALRLQGLGWTSEGITTASLDHALWLHRPFDPNDWLLYRQEAVSVQSDRALVSGRFTTAEGVLVATVAQEGLVRVPRASSAVKG